ncbi:MAG: DUF4058 family protein [Fimbriiglobus sp.]
MPIHDWTRVDTGRFHHFHQAWAVYLAAALNRGGLPPGFEALVEQKAAGWEPDVLALMTDTPPRPDPAITDGGLAIALAPPHAQIVTRESEAEAYARKASRVTVHRDGGELVAVVEIVSPGNKDSRHAIAAFVRKATDLIERGIHLLVVDLFPPNPRAPDGIHKAIWDEFREEPFVRPATEPLVAASYLAARPRTAYVEPLGVGDALPALPIFLAPGRYVPAPLEESYTRVVEESADGFRRLLADTLPLPSSTIPL